MIPATPDTDLRLTTASSPAQMQAILALQQRYHAHSLSLAEQEEGFVFAEHSLPLLEKMAAELPQVIALSGDTVAGYSLALPISLRADIPQLEPMFHAIEGLEFRGQAVSRYTWFIGGQVCVDRPWRGQGLMARLYQHTGRMVPPEYQVCITEIAARNQVSQRAHRRVGFEEISRHHSDGEEWVMVAWLLPGRS